MFDVSAITLYYVFQGNAAYDSPIYFGKWTLVTVVILPRDVAFFSSLGLPETSRDGKPSPEAFRIHIWVVLVVTVPCRVLLDELLHFRVCGYYTVILAARRNAVLLQRPLLMAACCTDEIARNLLITNIDCWMLMTLPWHLRDSLWQRLQMLRAALHCICVQCVHDSKHACLLKSDSLNTSINQSINLFAKYDKEQV